MKSIVALICLCFVQHTVAAADTCLATADLAINCEPAADDTCPADTADCSTFNAKDDCDAKSCIWSDGAVCTDGCLGKTETACTSPCEEDGTCQACADLTTSEACGLAAGCNWNDPNCEDGACPDTTAAEAACDAEIFCTWESSACTAKTDYCVGLDVTGGGACETDAGCEVENTDCKAKDCSVILTDGTCTADPGCKDDGGDCVPNDCADYTVDTECAAKGSCTWDTSATPVCVDKDEPYCGEVACDADAECEWNNDACAIKADLCSLEDKNDCTDVTRCNWEFECKQPDGDCSSNEQADCTDECTWNADGACSANTACGDLDNSDNCCANECSWVDCDEISAGDMLNVAVSTLLLSLMSVKLLF